MPLFLWGVIVEKFEIAIMIAIILIKVKIKMPPYTSGFAPIF